MTKSDWMWVNSTPGVEPGENHCADLSNLLEERIWPSRVKLPRLRKAIFHTIEKIKIGEVSVEDCRTCDGFRPG